MGNLLFNSTAEAAAKDAHQCSELILERSSGDEEPSRWTQNTFLPFSCQWQNLGLRKKFTWQSGTGHRARRGAAGIAIPAAQATADLRLRGHVPATKGRRQEWIPDAALKMDAGFLRIDIDESGMTIK